MERKIIIADSMEDLYCRAAQQISTRAQAAIARQGRFTMALSGGAAVKGTNRFLAVQQGIDWHRVFFFWGDERFVENSHPDSNYKLNKESLLDKINIPAPNAFPIPTDCPNAQAAALQYERNLQQFFSLSPGELPVFDLAFNGMGPDGHTASIFPGNPEPEPGRLVVTNSPELEPWVDRITLTLPVFNRARCVLFAITGKHKSSVLKKVLAGNMEYPAARILPDSGKLIWVISPEAAELIGNT